MIQTDKKSPDTKCNKHPEQKYFSFLGCVELRKDIDILLGAIEILNIKMIMVLLL